MVRVFSIHLATQGSSGLGHGSCPAIQASKVFRPLEMIHPTWETTGILLNLKPFPVVLIQAAIFMRRSVGVDLRFSPLGQFARRVRDRHGLKRDSHGKGKTIGPRHVDRILRCELACLILLPSILAPKKPHLDNSPRQLLQVDNNSILVLHIYAPLLQILVQRHRARESKVLDPQKTCQWRMPSSVLETALVGLTGRSGGLPQLAFGARSAGVRRLFGAYNL